MTKTPVPARIRSERATAKKVAYADVGSDDESMQIDENANPNMPTKRARKDSQALTNLKTPFEELDAGDWACRDCSSINTTGTMCMMCSCPK